MKRSNVLWALGWVTTMCLCLLVISASGCKKDEPKAPDAPVAPEKAVPEEKPEAPKEPPAAQPTGKLVQTYQEHEAQEKDKTTKAKPAPTTKVVNSRCPITGVAINRKSVATHLTRTFDGQKIGFSNAASLKSWDKLAEGQKRTKLAAAMPTKKPEAKPQEKPGGAPESR